MVVKAWCELWDPARLFGTWKTWIGRPGTTFEVRVLARAAHAGGPLKALAQHSEANAPVWQPVVLADPSAESARATEGRGACVLVEIPTQR
jgi:hypothetical protein